MRGFTFINVLEKYNRLLAFAIEKGFYFVKKSLLGFVGIPIEMSPFFSLLFDDPFFQGFTVFNVETVYLGNLFDDWVVISLFRSHKRMMAQVCFLTIKKCKKIYVADVIVLDGWSQG
jgi:hypothetical protein